MPFQSWELRPHTTNRCLFTLFAAIIELEIEIKVQPTSTVIKECCCTVKCINYVKFHLTLKSIRFTVIIIMLNMETIINNE